MVLTEISDCAILRVLGDMGRRGSQTSVRTCVFEGPRRGDTGVGETEAGELSPDRTLDDRWCPGDEGA